MSKGINGTFIILSDGSSDLLLHGLCICHFNDNNNSGSYSGVYSRNWRRDMPIIDSINLKNLSKILKEYGVPLQRTSNSWLRLGNYLINDEIVPLGEFLDEYNIREDDLGLRNIDSIILKQIDDNLILDSEY